MAMLAERRERKRYNLVPRGKALYEDGGRFGTRMLEKMGWTKGKGLGANESGEKEFVRVRYKNDSAGLGFEDRNDQWTQHESEFEKLLKKLSGEGENGAGTKNGDAEEDDSMAAAFGFGFKVDSHHVKTTEFSGESLEEKSKKSRARVHYMKFTRGKDISQYSKKDLANIFGRKQLVAYGDNEEDRRGSAQKSQTPSDDEKQKTASFGVTTIKSGTSLNDYFKAKMESARKKLKTNYNGNISTYDNVETVDGINPFKEKPGKKQKHNHTVNELHSVVESMSENCSDVMTETKETKKSKKRKNCEKQICKLENTLVKEEEETICTQSRKTNRNAQDIQTHNIDDSIISISDGSNGKRRKKTKKLNANCDKEPQPSFPDDVEGNVYEKKNKEMNRIKAKRERKKYEDEIICIERSGIEDVNEISMCSKKPKKVKKHRKDLENDIQEQISVVDCEKCENSSEQDSFHKKQLKKRKDQNTDHKQNEEKDEMAKTATVDCTAESVLIKTNDVLSLPVRDYNIDMKSELKEQVHQNRLPSSAGAEPFQFPELSMRVRKRKSSKRPRMQEKEIITKQTSDEIDSSTQPEEEDDSKLTISEDSVETFCEVDIDGFPGSNWCDIVGYRLSGRVKIEIKFNCTPEDKTLYCILFDNTTKNTIRPSAVEQAKQNDVSALIRKRKKKRSAFPIVV